MITDTDILDAQVNALRDLLGITTGFPDKTVAIVVMIAEAKRRGVTWNQIGAALGCENGKAAKAAAKALAKLVNARLVAEAAKGLEAA